MAFTPRIIRLLTCSTNLSSRYAATGPGRRRRLKWLLPLLGGIGLGQLYYHYLLKKIPFPGNVGFYFALFICLFLGIGNVVCVQLRCVSLLTLLMYCGKPGRGVLKVVVLTYVIAGPITNMCLNAKEVVRVYACSTELSQNLSGVKFAMLAAPFRTAVFGLRPEVSQIKDTIKSIRDVITPIELEVGDYCDPSGTQPDISRVQKQNRSEVKRLHSQLPTRLTMPPKSFDDNAPRVSYLSKRREYQATRTRKENNVMGGNMVIV